MSLLRQNEQLPDSHAESEPGEFFYSSYEKETPGETMDALYEHLEDTALQESEQYETVVEKQTQDGNGASATTQESGVINPNDMPDDRDSAPEIIPARSEQQEADMMEQAKTDSETQAQASDGNSNGGDGTLTSIPIPDKYTVQAGDNLSTIAHNNNLAGKTFMSIEALAILNGIDNPNNINVGDELILTADKAVVEQCNTDIQKFSNALGELNSAVQALSLEGIDSDNGELDANFNEIKNRFNSNTNTILDDAQAYSGWLSDLSRALDDTELWATQVISSDIMYDHPNSF